jgi:hypothetical protein
VPNQIGTTSNDASVVVARTHMQPAVVGAHSRSKQAPLKCLHSKNAACDYMHHHHHRSTAPQTCLGNMPSTQGAMISSGCRKTLALKNQLGNREPGRTLRLQFMQHHRIPATETCSDPHRTSQQDSKTSSAHHLGSVPPQHRKLLLLLPSQPAAHNKLLPRLVGKHCSSLRWKH